ncbi:MAG: 2-oxoacid:acceptor oxidoreductase family protein [Desulfurococcaceae archaeon]|jgi:pyruvate ferredoxin oxidoreductase gamma subunit|nr:2-oxoacid:acceptor oxidoreductase family protein [Desulfurococcaceae archaeon]
MLYEILFYGRGGQGAVTASHILVQAAIYENKYGQGFPFFSAERRGAPVTAYARISDKPILRRGVFSKADLVVVFDHRLIQLGLLKKVLIKNNGILIVNARGAEISRNHINVEGKVHVYAVDATKIAEELGLIVAGWPVVNTAMLGAIVRALPILSIQSVEKAIIEYLGPRIGESNREAASRAYKELVYLGEV